MRLSRSYTVTEARDVVKLADGVSVQVIDAGECTMTQRFLMIGQEETAEFRSLKEISAVILILGHGEHVGSWR